MGPLPRSTRRGLAALGAALVAAGAHPGRAAADGPGFSIGAEPAWAVLAGATAGASVTASRGALVGGELSLVRVREQRFAGLYADAYYDFGAGGTYLTAGPELGWIRRSRALPLAVGIDGGGVLRLGADADGGDPALGVTGRLFVAALGTAALYARYAYLARGGAGDAMAGGDHVVQVGVTIKLAIGRAFGPAARQVARK
jgi:hypothetical protein